MRPLAAICALLLVAILIIPSAVGDQALLLSNSNCYNLVPAGAQLTAVWGPNVNNCYKTANIGFPFEAGLPSFRCISQACMNNGTRDCDVKICAAPSITMDNACTVPSQLWIYTYYTGGGPR